MANPKICLEQINEKTFPDFKPLVLEQAAHHQTTYKGDDTKFITALTRKDAVPKLLVARDGDTDQPIGYILFNHYHTLKGQELYIEDLLVSSTLRSGGLGLAMIEKLKEHGRQLGINGITWAVTQNNTRAIDFYEQKVQAGPLDYVVHECGELFKKPVTAPAGYEVRKADAADLDLIESYVGRLPGLTKEKVAHIRAAAAAPNATVYIALDTSGEPKAIGIVNANYSSFGTAYGYKLEVAALAAKDEADAVGAFKALTATVAADGKAAGNDGHLDIVIDKNAADQKTFMKDLGFSPLQMTDDPASVFLAYGIGRDKIYPPAAKNVIDIKTAKKDGPQQSAAFKTKRYG